MDYTWKYIAAVGCVSVVGLLSGCGGVDAPPVTISPGSPSSSPTNAAVYVIQQNNAVAVDQVLKFPAGSSGSITPSLSLVTNLYLDVVAVDSAGQIYAGGLTASQVPTINVYPANSNGTVAPTRTITLSATALAITTDSAGSLYVADKNNEILVFNSTAIGGATPTRTISGLSTLIGGPQGIAVDSTGTIYLADESSSGNIYTYAPGANGNVAPTTHITAPANTAFVGVALDSAKNIYATTDLVSGPVIASSVLEYSAGSNGTATPLKTITGSSTFLSSGTTDVGGVEVDSAGNIYLPVEFVQNNGYSYSIFEFSAGSNGNLAPYARVTSSLWSSGWTQIAVTAN